MHKIMNYSHIAQMAFNQPLLATAELAETVTGFLRNKISGAITEPSLNAGNTSIIPLGSPENGENIAVIPVHGVLVPRSGTLTNTCEEVMSYERLRSQITKELKNDQVKEIVLEIESGGGTAQAAFECAQFIYESKAIKPIRAIINFNAYSGAYLIACACTEIIVSDTSGVGSIGVYQKRVDLTKMYEAQGVVIHTFHRGARKVDFHPDMEMSDEEKKDIETNMDRTYKKFVDVVVKYRNMSIEAVQATEANTFEGQAAVDMGLADRVASPQDAINQISQNIIASQTSQKSNSILIQSAHMQMKSQL